MDRVFPHRQRLLRECRAIEVVFALFNALRDLLATSGLEPADTCFAVKVGVRTVNACRVGCVTSLLCVPPLCPFLSWSCHSVPLSLVALFTDTRPPSDFVAVHFSCVPAGIAAVRQLCHLRPAAARDHAVHRWPFLRRGQHLCARRAAHLPPVRPPAAGAAPSPGTMCGSVSYV
jgi:hypothetical protein